MPNNITTADLLRASEGAMDALTGAVTRLDEQLNLMERGGAKSDRTLSGRKMIHPAPQGGPALAGGTGYKMHHGAHGAVYELSAGVKMADVLAPKAQPEIPLDRWLSAALIGERCEDKAARDFVRETKDLTGGTTGILLPEVFQGEWIDNLRANMVLEAAGMATATMTGKTVTASRVAADPTVGWRAEGGAVAESDPTFELRQLVAKSVAVRAQASVELAQDSPDFGAQLLNVFSRVLAAEIDRVGLVGTGASNEPRGIQNTSGVGAVAAVGSPIPQDFITGLQTLLNANVELGRADRNAIMSPRTWATLESLQSADGQPIMRPKAIENMVYRPTKSIPDDLGVGNDESIAILGDFADLVMGVRLEASVEALRLQTYASNLLLEFVGHARVDFLVRRPASFVVLSGITT